MHAFRQTWILDTDISPAESEFSHSFLNTSQFLQTDDKGWARPQKPSNKPESREKAPTEFKKKSYVKERE